MILFRFRKGSCYTGLGAINAEACSNCTYSSGLGYIGNPDNCNQFFQVGTSVIVYWSSLRYTFKEIHAKSDYLLSSIISNCDTNELSIKYKLIILRKCFKVKIRTHSSMIRTKTNHYIYVYINLYRLLNGSVWSVLMAVLMQPYSAAWKEHFGNRIISDAWEATALIPEMNVLIYHPQVSQDFIWSCAFGQTLTSFWWVYSRHKILLHNNPILLRHCSGLSVSTRSRSWRWLQIYWPTHIRSVRVRCWDRLQRGRLCVCRWRYVCVRERV